MYVNLKECNSPYAPEMISTFFFHNHLFSINLYISSFIMSSGCIVRGSAGIKFFIT